MRQALKCLAVFVLGLLYPAGSSPAGNASEWLIGIYGPITSVSHLFLAAAVAFDLDLRKHFEPDLAQRLGPPVVQIPSVHPLLREVGVAIGTSHSNADIGSETALNWWLLGGGSAPQVMAAVGGSHSFVTARVASLLASLKIPQVAWGSTSPSLSDKSQYPFLLRTIPSDAIQGRAMWVWTEYFLLQSVSLLYAEEPYGEGFLRSVLEAADAQAHRVKAVNMPSMPDPDSYDVNLATASLQGVRESGSRFILLALGGTEATSALHLLEQAGLVGSDGRYQVLGAESVFPLADGPRLPSREALLGFLKLYPVAAGPLWPRFEELWTNLTTADLYAEGARERYMLGSMQVSLESGRAPMLTAEDFGRLSSSEPGIHMFSAFLFDSAYTVVLAINELLNKGIGLASMSSNSSVLLEQMKATVFNGVTGKVDFDDVGDRAGDFHLWNLQSNNSDSVRWALVGLYETASNSFMAYEDTIWATGDKSGAVPQALLSCPPGFQRESSTNLCEKCRPGIGCGFQAEDGFPIGIFGPFTSASHEVLALAVLFDLDFRKNTDPALRQRFGPPIVTIPNLHPDLKIKTQLGTSDSKVSTGVETALDWCTGAGDIYKVAGIVGGSLSAVTRPVASNAGVFEVPQVGFGASSPSLSDKTLYPWFSRVNPPDTLQSEALWVWMLYFKVPSVAFAYSRDPYGEGIFQPPSLVVQATIDRATSAGEPGRVHGVSFRFQTSEDYDMDDDRDACLSIQSIGSKFVVFAIPSRSHLTSFFYVMETLGMLYGPEAYQVMGFEGLIITESNQYVPSMGLPVGCQRLQPATQGRLYPELLEMWHKLSPEDLYGSEATRRYMLNYFKVLLADSRRPMLTDASFQQGPTTPFYLFIVDAAYTFVFAINSLLNQGVPPEDIFGQKLLDEVRRTTFEGVTGNISFNELADRHTDSELWNVQLSSTGGQPSLGSVARWQAGSANFIFDDANATADTSLTWARGIVSPSAPDELTACPAGYHWDEALGFCAACKKNTYSSGTSGEKITQCESCGPGSVSINETASIGCVPCPKGTHRIDDYDCVQCPAGTFGADEGQSACEECSVGNYSSAEGQHECEICGFRNVTRDLFTTMKVVRVFGVDEFSYLSGATTGEHCGCDRGSRLDGRFECILCTEGMLCKGMNSVEVLPGYFAGPIADGRLSIFKCHGSSSSLRCPGGLPGQTCADGREGITCAECNDRKTPGDDGKCIDCGGSDHGTFIISVLLAVLMLIFMYYVVDTQNRATGSHAMVLAGTSVGLLMTTIQLLAVLGTLPLQYKDPLKSLLSAFSFDLELVRINCVSTYGPLSRYIIKVAMILIVVCILGAIHILGVLCYHGRASGWRLHSLAAGIGSIFMVFYIAVTSTVLEPLQCQQHPNTRWTVLSYPSVLCWEEGDHKTMLMIGVGAFVLVPLSYMVVCIVAVRQFPSRMSAGDIGFLKAFSFLFVRFHASHHTFVLIQMMRSFAVAMVLVVPNEVVVIFFLEVILLSSYTASLALQPWRVAAANVLDCLQGAFSLLVVCQASLFQEIEKDDQIGMASVAVVFVVTSISFSVAGVGYGLFRKYARRSKPFQFFLCHHKAGAGAYTRLLKLQLLDHPKVVAGVFLDSDNLNNLDSLFDHVGNSTSTLVVVCSAEIFSRPWCLGEMCTARLRRVPLCRVGLPSGMSLDEDFISGLASNIEGMDALAENGIDDEMVQTTLRWIADTPMLNVPERADLIVMTRVADRLVMKEWSDVLPSTRIAAKSSSLLDSGHVLSPLLYDKSNREAEATASILKKLLTPLMVHRSELIPEPWGYRDLPSGAATILVLCSNGIFADENVLHLLSRPCHSQLQPVLAEASFRFPGKDFADDLLKQYTGMETEEVAAIALFVRNLFKEIAVSFAAQLVGEAELKLAANNISARLLNAGGKATGKFSEEDTTSPKDPQFSAAVQHRDPDPIAASNRERAEPELLVISKDASMHPASAVATKPGDPQPSEAARQDGTELPLDSTWAFWC